MDILRKLPTELCEKIYLMSIDTGHAKHIEEYWKRKKLKMLLENFENHFANFRLLHPITGAFRRGYTLYNYCFAEDDNSYDNCIGEIY